MADSFPVASETFVSGEVEELRRQGHRVTVECIHRPDRPAPGLRVADGVRYMTDERAGEKALALAWLVSHHPLRCAGDLIQRRRWRGQERVRPLRAIAVRARRAVREDVAHMHVHFAGEAALEAMRIGRILGLPFSVTVHAFDVFSAPRNLRVKLRSAAFAESVCEYTTEHLRRVAGPGAEARLQTRTMGVDLDVFRRTAPYPGGRSVLAVGRLVEKKGFRFLVEAIAHMRDHRHRVERLVIVGDGPLRAELEEAIRGHGLTGMVELVGERPPVEVRVLLERADVLAVPSVVASDGDRDSMPVVVFEALAMEVPVVASDEVGLPEHVRVGWGRLAPPGDPVALGGVLAELLALPVAERAAMGRAGRAWAQERCDRTRECARLVERIEYERAQLAVSSSR